MADGGRSRHRRAHPHSNRHDCRRSCRERGDPREPATPTSLRLRCRRKRRGFRRANDRSRKCLTASAVGHMQLNPLERGSSQAAVGPRGGCLRVETERRLAIGRRRGAAKPLLEVCVAVARCGHETLPSLERSSSDFLRESPGSRGSLPKEPVGAASSLPRSSGPASSTSDAKHSVMSACTRPCSVCSHCSTPLRIAARVFDN